MTGIEIDQNLVDAVIRSTNVGLQMAGIVPKPVGCSRLPSRAQEISVLIGIVGRSYGVVTLNASRQVALRLANKFMDADIAEVNDQVLDALGEITNIVAGKLKAELVGDKHEITSISCPSIVVGADYYLHHFRGFKTVSVEFELEEVPTMFYKERFFSTTVSLG